MEVGYTENATQTKTWYLIIAITKDTCWLNRSLNYSTYHSLYVKTLVKDGNSN